MQLRNYIDTTRTRGIDRKSAIVSNRVSKKSMFKTITTAKAVLPVSAVPMPGHRTLTETERSIVILTSGGTVTLFSRANSYFIVRDPMRFGRRDIVNLNRDNDYSKQQQLYQNRKYNAKKATGRVDRLPIINDRVECIHIKVRDVKIIEYLFVRTVT